MCDAGAPLAFTRVTLLEAVLDNMLPQRKQLRLQELTARGAPASRAWLRVFSSLSQLVS